MAETLPLGFFISENKTSQFGGIATISGIPFLFVFISLIT